MITAMDKRRLSQQCVARKREALQSHFAFRSDAVKQNTGCCPVLVYLSYLVTVCNQLLKIIGNNKLCVTVFGQTETESGTANVSSRNRQIATTVDLRTRA